MSAAGVCIRLRSLRGNTAGEYALRFLFGGAVCALAGWVADRYGPVIGGLLLAVPAIFPASATLIEDHEESRKRKFGWSGTLRGRGAAAVDAEGAALGCLGLIAFALVVWQLLPRCGAGLTLLAATSAWLAAATAGWWLRRKL